MSGPNPLMENKPEYIDLALGLGYNVVHCFFHEEASATLTSRGVIWTFPNKKLMPNSVCVMPEHGYNGNLDECLGICSDYIKEYKK